MAGKPVFTDEQKEILHEAGKRVWARMKKEGKTQEDMALAMGVAQQSISNMIKGTYSPGLKPARQLANLDGKTLEQLVGEFGVEDPATESGPRAATAKSGDSFANLDVCIQFHAATKHWSPWTIAAARAGFFGLADFAPPEWVGKLDALEKALERARKAG
jgi:transcriptional regulator with XRE-family HTH domain